MNMEKWIHIDISHELRKKFVVGYQVKSFKVIDFLR